MADPPEYDWRPQVPDLIPPALSLAFRLCGDRQLAEDSVQEALVKLARYGDGFRGQSELSTYFARIVINACNDQLSQRQQRNEKPLQTETIAGPESASPDFASQQAEQVARIRQAVDQLSERQRNVLVLSVWEQRTPEEIGQLLEMNIQNVYSTLSLARQQLKKLLTDCQHLQS